VALLRLLVERAGGPVSKDALIEAAWPGLAVEESNLSVQIAALRKVLGEEPGGDTLIETLPRRGYRFVGTVTKGTPRTAVDVPGGPSAPEPVATTQPEALENELRRIGPERRQLTILCCELLLPARVALDPEDLRGIVKNYRQWAADTIDRFSASIDRYVGTTVLAYFGYPAAHEDDAEQAVRAGLHLCTAVENLASNENVQLRCRVGIATGLVIAGEQAEIGDARALTVVGEAPSVAHRLQALGQPGTVMIDGTTRRLIGNLFQCRDLATVYAGFDEAFQVLGPSKVESRFEALRTSGLTELVGREEETELLLRRWHRARGREGQVVLVSGEAGIGKSRLTAAVLERLASEHHTLRYSCSPRHTDSALYPVAGQMERAAGFTHQDDPRVKLDKLDAVLARTSTSDADAALFAELLSLPNDGRYPVLALAPKLRRQRMLEALTSHLAALARQQPVLMVFEDVHWADPTSLEWLSRTIEFIHSIAVLLIVTFRPEFAAPWVGQAHVRSLTLNRLGEREVAVMIERLAGTRKLRADVLAQIVARTDGIPLFVEEMTKAVLEAESEGEVPRTAGVGPASALAVPASLQASLMARLDRLGPAREIAQVGAAIGREFSHAVLAAVVPKPEAQLVSALDRLIVAGLLFRHGVPPHAVYLFKHALVRDAAHGTLLRQPRRALHALIAKTIESQFAEIAESEPELLAHHCVEAGLDEAAVEWFRKAGEQAFAQCAFEEAVSHLGKAIEMADKAWVDSTRTEGGSTLASRRLQLQASYGQALMWSRGYSAVETKAAFTRAQELATGIDDASERFTAHYGLWLGTFLRGELGIAREMAETFVAGANHGERIAQAVAQRFLGLTCFCQGDFLAAQTHLEEALSIFDRERDREAGLRFADTAASASVYLAHTSRVLGEVARARELMEQGVARAVECAHVPTLVNTYYFQALSEIFRGDAESAWRISETLVELSQKHGFVLFIALGTLCRGWARARLGDHAGGATELRGALTGYTELGNKLYLPIFQGLLAEIEAESEEPRGALTRIDAALALADETGERCTDAFLHCIRGEILHRATPANMAGAEQAFLTAVAIAQRQKARSFELLAARALAALYQSTGRLAAAHAVLTPALTGFAPTADLPEVAKAQALLNALAL
jgi:class 3 adenylate cyclase/tetratricopeptide (TPR) repeat protein